MMTSYDVILCDTMWSYMSAMSLCTPMCSGWGYGQVAFFVVSGRLPLADLKRHEMQEALTKGSHGRTWPWTTGLNIFLIFTSQAAACRRLACGLHDRCKEPCWGLSQVWPTGHGRGRSGANCLYLLVVCDHLYTVTVYYGRIKKLNLPNKTVLRNQKIREKCNYCDSHIFSARRYFSTLRVNSQPTTRGAALHLPNMERPHQPSGEMFLHVMRTLRLFSVFGTTSWYHLLLSKFRVVRSWLFWFRDSYFLCCDCSH